MNPPSRPPAPAAATRLAPPADQAALARVGATVRKRLEADPVVYKIPTDEAEIFAVANFLDAAECARFIAIVDRVAKPSRAFDTDYAQNYRTSYSGDVDPADPFVRMIERRISDLLGLPPACGETVQGQRYLPGQEFKPHNDWFWTNAHYWPAERKRGGQRSWTAMAYLNGVDEGGATDFPTIGLSIPPQPGALLIWNNARADGKPNDATLHAGTPVIQGVKYVITKWFRTRKWG